jgi:spore cortex formation protein SpoVR/YcgB (stage V sporulation)
VPLADSKNEVIKHLHYLWQFEVKLVQDIGSNPETIIARCPENQEKII